jgi:DNA-binding LacI/PurR family transcriptional regulator
VQLGSGTANPAISQIALDPAGIVRLAMQHVLYAGHRRIGFVLPHRWDKLTDQVWSAAFHAEQYRCHLKDRLPVLHLQSPLDADPADPPSAHHAANDATSLLRWHHQYRPEVVLGSSPVVLEHIRHCGFQVPGDFAYADLLLADASGPTAGVWVDASRMGEFAVEMIAARLQQNLLGLPSVATVTSVGGQWRAGPTLPGSQAEAAKGAGFSSRYNLAG